MSQKHRRCRAGVRRYFFETTFLQGEICELLDWLGLVAYKSVRLTALELLPLSLLIVVRLYLSSSNWLAILELLGASHAEEMLDVPYRMNVIRHDMQVCTSAA